MPKNCSHCPPAVVEMITDGLIGRRLDQLAAGLECTYCGTVWGVLVRHLDGDAREVVLTQIRAAASTKTTTKEKGE